MFMGAGKKLLTADFSNGMSLSCRPNQNEGEVSPSSVAGEDGMDWTDAEAGD